MLSRWAFPEPLDDLPEDDPQAMRSRRDLRRIHGAMGTRSILLHALQDMSALRRIGAPLRILELGAGDGSLMLGVARALAPTWAPVHLTLLGAQPLVTQDTIARYADLGWTAIASVLDVFEWADGPAGAHRHGKRHAPWDLIVTNLFLHHFEGAQLAGLLRSIADRSDRFLACEPRRAWLRLVGGFRGSELTALWPDVGDTWEVQEYPAGLFSHCFRAEPILRD